MENILLGEDYSSLRTFLGKAGYMVTSCEDDLQAIASLGLREYDQLLADIVIAGIGDIEPA